MLNKTALSNPAFLVKIKAATLAAVADCSRSGKPVSRVIHNRKGRPAILVCAYPGGIVGYIDAADDDVTDQVKAALRAWHAAARLPVVHYDSGPVEGLSVVCRPSLSVIEGGKQPRPLANMGAHLTKARRVTA